MGTLTNNNTPALPTEGPELTPSGTFDSGPDIATTAGPNYGDWEIGETTVPALFTNV